jgi:8-oxo-dGTP diphosphatase
MSASASPGDGEQEQDQARKVYCYAYPRPAVTVDLAAFTLVDTALRVLLVRRKNEPFAGRWALPGGFVEMDEPIEAAARRELREETGLDITVPVELIGVFGDPGRDPRGRTISLVHGAVIPNAGSDADAVAVAGADDAAEAAWRDCRLARELAFDHDAILAAALDWLGRRVGDGAFALGILPREFGDDQVKALFGALGKPARAAITWRGRMLRGGQIAPAGPGPNQFRAVAEENA